MTDAGSVVRPATPEDSLAIADAHVRGWQAAYRGLVPDRILDGFDVTRRAAWWADRLADPSAAPDERIWVVAADDGIAGFAHAGPARSEAFVSFGRRIGARPLAEGIERRADLAMITGLGVDLGQGYLLGRPSATPAAPRPIETLRLDAARVAAGRSGRSARAAFRSGQHLAATD